MAWSSLAYNQAVSGQNLLDAVNIGVFAQKPSTTIPNNNKVLTMDEAYALVQVSLISSNELVVVSDLVPNLRYCFDDTFEFFANEFYPVTLSINFGGSTTGIVAIDVLTVIPATGRTGMGNGRCVGIDEQTSTTYMSDLGGNITDTYYFGDATAWLDGMPKQGLRGFIEGSSTVSFKFDSYASANSSVLKHKFVVRPYCLTTGDILNLHWAGDTAAGAADFGYISEYDDGESYYVGYSGTRRYLCTDGLNIGSYIYNFPDVRGNYATSYTAIPTPTNMMGFEDRGSTMPGMAGGGIGAVAGTYQSLRVNTFQTTAANGYISDGTNWGRIEDGVIVEVGSVSLPYYNLYFTIYTGGSEVYLFLDSETSDGGPTGVTSDIYADMYFYDTYTGNSFVHTYYIPYGTAAVSSDFLFYGADYGSPTVGGLTLTYVELSPSSDSTWIYVPGIS